MGDSYIYKCLKCGYEQDFNQGYGFIVHPQSVNEYLNLNKKLFHHKVHNKIVELSRQNNNLNIKAAFQDYICPTCKLLYDKAEIVVMEDEKIVHRSRFRCAECKGRLKRTNIHRLKTATCPKCRKKTFKRVAGSIGLWS
jgi:DNA-directed RNA polymerase subunit RPC12/RpoP